MKYCLLILYLLSSLTVNAQEPRLVLPIGHTNAVKCARYSPNGKFIVTASGDNTCKVWDAASGKLVYDLRGHTNSVIYSEFSPDGKFIITASLDNTAKIWDLKSGKLIHELNSHLDPLKSAKFSKSGKFVITASVDETAKIWDAISGKILQNLKGHTFFVESATFSPDEKYVVTGSLDHTAKIWDVISGKLIHNLEGHSNSVYYAEFSPNGKFVITASLDNTAKIWDATSGKFVCDLVGHFDYVSFSEFSPDGIFVVTASGDGTAKIWEVASGNLIHDLNKHAKSVYKAKFSPNGKYLVTSSWDSTAKVWDVASGKLVYDLRDHTNSVIYSEFSPDGKFIITASLDNTAKIWDFSNGHLLHNLKGYTKPLLKANFSLDGKLIIAEFIDKTTKVWNVLSGEIVHILLHEKVGYGERVYSPLGKFMVTMSESNAAKVWDISSGKLLYQLGNKDYAPEYANFSNNEKLIITASKEKNVKIWSTVSGKMLFQLNGLNYLNGNETISPNDKHILTISSDSTAMMWDATSGQLIHKLRGHTDKVYTATFQSNGKFVVTNSADKTIKVWNATSGKLIHSFQRASILRCSQDGKLIATSSDNYFTHSHEIKIWNAATGKLVHSSIKDSNPFNSIKFSPDSKYLFTTTSDSTIKKWDLETCKLLQKIQLDIQAFNQEIDFKNSQLLSINDSEIKIFNISSGVYNHSFLNIDNSEYLTITQADRYSSSPNVAKLLHYVTKDLKIITFDQLDVKYNRPDKVLEALGNTDTALINSYRKAYQKRIKKLGIDTTQFRDGYSVPESDFMNRNAIEYEQIKEKLILKIKANDSTYTLDRFNVWVNEVPLFGLRGVKTKRFNNFDTTITITLSQGENRIETSVINTNGTESYKMPLFVKYTPAKPIEEKQYFIGIGINQFANPDYNLSWSVKDIRDLALKLKTKYPNIIIDTLFDSNVTKENILALKQKLLQLKEDDKVIVSYSGHGVLSKEFDYFLSTYSINFNNPAEKGLAYDDLESLLDNIKPRKKLMLIDACHSGEVDKEEIAKIEAAKSSLNNNGVTTKSTIKVVPKKNLGMANSFELMQSLFVNVGKGTGATIISAAGGMQYAQERGDLKNGVFTYSLIEAFNQNPTLKVSELKMKVGERVSQLTNGLQKPTSRNQTNNYDWVIW